MVVFYLIAIFIANCILSFNLIASNMNDEISPKKRSITLKEEHTGKRNRKISKTKDENPTIEKFSNEIANLMPVKVLKKDGTKLQSSYPERISYPNLCRIFLAPLVLNKDNKAKSPNNINGPKIVTMKEEPRPGKVEILVEIGGEKVCVKCSHKVMHGEIKDKIQSFLGLVRNEITHQLRSIESIDDSAEGPELGVQIIGVMQEVMLPNRAIHTLGTEENAKSSLVKYQIYKNGLIVEELPSFIMAFARKLV